MRTEQPHPCMSKVERTSLAPLVPEQREKERCQSSTSRVSERRRVEGIAW